MKLLGILAVVFNFASPAVAEGILVFGAASLKEPLDDVAASAGDVSVSYGGSGTLARQVSLGAPADLVILANPVWMDVLEEDGLVRARADILSNRLVLVSARAGSVPLTNDGLLAALGAGRLAIGRTTSVPAGIYGKAALESLGLWQGVGPLLAETDSVRAALALVARGEVPLGVVYETDARIVPELHIVATFPAESHPPITYVAGLLSDDPAALAFYDALQSEQGLAVFEAAGFIKVMP